MDPLVLKTESSASHIVFASSIGETIQNVSRLIPDNRRVIALVDANVDKQYGYFFPYEKIMVNAVECEKSLETVSRVTCRLMEMGAGRDIFLLGVGGGITTDLCGFVASIYKRGAAFGFVPTTLLAMVDASIGGKNGVNVDGYKNMLGTVNQPHFVVICPEFLSSFPKPEICKSVPELLKTRIISGKNFEETVEFFVKADFPSELKGEQLLHYIREAVSVKCDVVSKDERETGLRRILNLGHTFGHALERCSGNSLSHGEAVGIGLVLAAKNGGGTMMATRIAKALKQLGLPAQVPQNIDVSDLSTAVLQDKKNSGHLLNLVVVDDAGIVSFREKTVGELLWN